jgi:hypothetical protein
MTIQASDYLDVVTSVTKEWTKQRKAEERGSRRPREYVYSDRVDFTEVADDILPKGYAHASGNGKYTCDNRQFYYVVRDEFLAKTGREITVNYFCQNLLVKYMNRNPNKTADWKITASPRGTLTIPHTKFDPHIPCGTLAIDKYLHRRAKEVDPFKDVKEAILSVEWPSAQEGHRYQAVLYIEKEGFEPQLQEAQIAHKFDIAIISCKGQSVKAARKLVDHVCRVNGGVPLFVAHDMDKAGFEICQRLTTVSDYAREHDLVKYEFKNEINVIDLGLRLKDAQKYNLKSERVQFTGYFADDSTATDEEKSFLRSNRRVELNAFTAPQFIEWLVSGLEKHLGKRRFIPADTILRDAWRRALAIAAINKAINDARKSALEQAEGADMPDGLRKKLEKGLKDSPQAWDQVLYDLAEKSIEEQ